MLNAELLHLPADHLGSWTSATKKASGMMIHERVDNYVKSLPPKSVIARWDDLFTTFTAFFIVSLGFGNVCVREMHPAFLMFPPMLHCVCVCFLFNAVLVFYFQPWSVNRYTGQMGGRRDEISFMFE